MNTAQRIRNLFDKHHLYSGFLPVQPLIDAGFEWEVAHIINDMTSQRKARTEFLKNSVECNIEIHIDWLSEMIGTEVFDARGSAMVFEDGSALMPDSYAVFDDDECAEKNRYVVLADGSEIIQNMYGRVFIHPVDFYVKNNDVSFCDDEY